MGFPEDPESVEDGAIWPFQEMIKKKGIKI